MNLSSKEIHFFCLSIILFSISLMFVENIMILKIILGILFGSWSMGIVINRMLMKKLQRINYVVQELHVDIMEMKENNKMKQHD